MLNINMEPKYIGIIIFSAVLLLLAGIVIRRIVRLIFVLRTSKVESERGLAVAEEKASRIPILRKFIV
jgi:hypothetical protein